MVQCYGTLQYIQPDKGKRVGHWQINGYQPSMMAKRIMPSCWCSKSGSIDIPDNMANVENIYWLMIRFPLKVESPIWATRMAHLHEIGKRRKSIVSLSPKLK
ncbi:MAG: hypothetical protein ACQCN3_02400 [Candidatus Bathyarchaeia archaeon]|jgi:hypothetical protein